jgi:hypothetical protein
LLRHQHAQQLILADIGNVVRNIDICEGLHNGYQRYHRYLQTSRAED